jgi:hypothetical protein
VNSKKKQRLILIATAHAELFGGSTSVSSVAKKYGVDVPTGRRWFRFPTVSSRLQALRTASPECLKQRKQMFQKFFRYTVEWVCPHETLRKKGLIEKPEDGPSRLTEAGWQMIEELIRNGGERFPHRKGPWPHKMQRRSEEVV